MIGDPRPYPEYRDSGQPWIGSLPRHWPVFPNRAVFKEVNDRGHADESMLSVTISKGVISQESLLSDSSKKDSSRLDKSAYKLVQPQDLVYNKMRAWQGAVGVSALRGIVSPAYVVMRLRERQNPRFFHHLCRTPYFAKEAERWSYGITSDMWSLRPQHFKMINTPIPPRDEQAAIVRYLDHVDGRINAYIRAKQKLIALLNEERQAIIRRAITRGVDADVELKPSGIPWLGDIPEHWAMWPIGRLARVGNGSTPSRSNPSYWTSTGYPWLNSSSVNRSPITSADQFVTPLALRQCHLPRVPAGSVLVAITGQGRTRGTAAVLGIEATINQHVAFISPKAQFVSSDYLQLFLAGSYAELRGISDDSGSTKGALTCGDLKHFRIALPSSEEQCHIVRAVQQATVRFDTATANSEREITSIREYRTRLIADVVTGQLDVREAAAKLPDEAPSDEALSIEPFDETIEADALAAHTADGGPDSRASAQDA